jgi:hypothetical protein
MTITSNTVVNKHPIHDDSSISSNIIVMFVHDNANMTSNMIVSAMVLLTRVAVRRCPACEHMFCFDCDLFIHETLHTCPGCGVASAECEG